MKVLVTGSSGFVGKNVVSTLRNLSNVDVLLFDRDDSLEVLESHAKVCDFVVHLAGINRPKNVSEFKDGNVTLTATLCEFLVKHDNCVPIIITSSIQAELENDYGKSKREGEDVLLKYAKENNAQAIIYRLTNLFGKWSRPFYNSVVATWCHLIARGEEIEISNPNHILTLVYIDDLVHEFLSHINATHETNDSMYYDVKITHDITLSDLASVLKSFKNNRDTLLVADFSDLLTKKLYSTYLSYLPSDSFAYDVVSHVDNRGSFTEILKQDSFGQVSINISKPGITKGEHWHHTKVEKFIVVQGTGLIQFRDVFETEVIEYEVTGEKMVVVDIPPGYTHNIINTGTSDMVTLMWVNESYDADHPDTYYERVIE